ncbi:uncharacterized protein LOC127726498 [Mytilus californianus]|uniref:uncharacterized protein LOC127726498 n=1 Tax=Mytilus californianus TaxID=6549 RepID=UPI002247D87C|nr:uncharacterized protein LOC127726498 [Mytilus californianus]
MLIHVSRNEELKNKVTEIQRQLKTQSKHLRKTVEKAVTVKLPKVLKKSVTSIDDRLGLMEKSTKETNLLVKRIETKQAENPKKLRFLDHTRKEIDQHIKEKTFVETRAIKTFMTIHSDKEVFLITGSAGKGKSRNGLDILRQLGEKYPTYDVVKVSNFHTVDKILNKDSRTILLLEDVFGKTNCRYSEDNDRHVLDILQAYINSGNVKVIFTIRSVVKKSLQYLHLFSSHRIFKGFEEINLNSSQFKMTKMEKERLLENYCSKNNIKIVHVGENENCYEETVLDKNVTVKINEATFTNIVNTDTYLGFPESCYMFTSNRALTRLGIQFFKHPTRFLNQEIDNLRRSGESNMKDRTCYITLVYILLSSNTLGKTVFDCDKAASILRSCYNRDSFIINSEIIGAADEMTGSYLTYNTETSVFQFQHQTIFESVMLSYYNVDPNLVLTMIDFEMLREVVKLSNYLAKEEEIKMIIPKQFYGNLAKRLFQIFHFQFRHMPSNFIKVLCDSDLMTQIDADFITQLGEHFIEASNHDISTIITYEGKSEEVVFCLLAAVLWFGTIKDWKTEDIKVILHSLKITLLSETRSNVNNACKRTIVAAFLYSCDKKNANDIIEFFLQTIDELEISFDINRCFQDVVDRQNQRAASCILQHF